MSEVGIQKRQQLPKDRPEIFNPKPHAHCPVAAHSNRISPSSQQYSGNVLSNFAIKNIATPACYMRILAIIHSKTRSNVTT
jgi:hypothetical protein